MIEAQRHTDMAEPINQAVLAAVLDEETSTSRLRNSEKRIGQGKPGPGRPKGGSNRVTRTIREAVEAASQPGACHDEGLAGWLIERARGSIGDRQIFAAMVNKAMPLQVQANVDGAIRIELGWLAGRKIGTTASQIANEKPQAIDLQQESDGTYRIIDQQPAQERAPEQAAGQGAEASGAEHD